MTEELLRMLVWTDYRLLVLFAILIPLGLLIWSFQKKIEAVQRLLVIYGRVASLLIITVYLMIPSWGIAYLTGFLARVFVVISLWFWVDLNEEIRDIKPSTFKLAISSWRWAMTAYGVLGAIGFSFFVPCAWQSNPVGVNSCKIWLEAPWFYKQVFHGGSTPAFLGFLGMMALCIYSIYFLYFIIGKLTKQGRMAIEQ